MSSEDLSLYAHLMRRAGFGATPEELSTYAAQGYKAVVEWLLHPEESNDIDEDLLERYYKIQWRPAWYYRMVNTGTPLNEKMTLFWHHMLAVGISKSNFHEPIRRQIGMFRRHALSDVRTVLTGVSADPAMIYWLDNQENFKNEPNENYGRELLELFSMGVGNYTEDDVKGATQAFTGWSFVSVIPGTTPYGSPLSPEFLYNDDQHDDGEKTFLGETDRFNGEGIIDLIVKQPATARFISRKLYDYFVSDEPPVASWNELAPQDPDAIDTLSEAYMSSGGQLRPMLRVLFNSDFFKEARFRKVKSPTELVAGLIRLQGTHRFPETGLAKYESATTVMGQTLLNPPTVEGWHTGPEWIDGGTLNERINFAVNEFTDGSAPGVQGIIEHLKAEGRELSLEKFVDRCLELVGFLELEDEVREGLLRHARTDGPISFSDSAIIEGRVVRMLQLIVSTREFQFA